MSHHIDTQEALKDGRLDLCDVYVFDAEDRRHTVFILTANPFAGATNPEIGAQQPVTFHPDAVYEFKMDLDADFVGGDFVEDVSYRFTFSATDATGEQRVELRRAEGAQAREGREGQVIAMGVTGTATTVQGGGRLWAGLAADPFFANGDGFGRFVDALQAENRFDPSLFDSPVSFSLHQNVNGIVLELPNAGLGAGAIRVWAVTTLWHHDQHLQVQREANPLMTHLFLQDARVKLEHNHGCPADDVQRDLAAVRDWVARAVQAAGSPEDPQSYGDRVAHELLPDVLTYRPGTAARYEIAARNGRRLTDDVVDVQLSRLVNRPVSDRIDPDGQYQSTFPYLIAPRSSEVRNV
jgi:hypothetical protein